MVYNKKDDLKFVMKEGRKMKKWFEKLCIATCMMLCMGLLIGTTVSATEANPSGTDGEAQETVEYTIVKEKEKIKMISGEMRMVTMVIPGDSTFESSNTKVIVVANNGQMKAKKAGTAKVTHTTGTTKTIYTVKVSDEVDLIVFAGQSNMCGSGGNASQAPTPAMGTAYEFDITTDSNRTILMKEPFGEGTNRANGLESTGRYSTNGTLVSAFCINYYKQTKVPVVGVSCAWGGTSTNTWLNRGLVTKTQKNLKLAKKQLKKNKIKIRHIYMVWYQGESDAMQGVSESTYISRMKKIYKKMKSVGVERVFVIRIGHNLAMPNANYSIMKAQDKLCAKNKNFVLVSKKASKYVDQSHYADTIHLNQKSLNTVGYEAGKAAGKYVKKNTKKKK